MAKTLVLEIPRTKKTYNWNPRKNGYERKILGTYPGDEGLEMKGRVFSYHPTKGWRSRRIPEKHADFSNKPNIIQWIQSVFRRRSLGFNAG